MQVDFANTLSFFLTYSSKPAMCMTDDEKLMYGKSKEYLIAAFDNAVKELKVKKVIGIADEQRGPN